MKTGIVVTGLPASGKSTIARSLAEAMDLPVFDKDDFLEELYDRHGVRTLDDRRHLSRKSDALFQNAALKAQSAVLVSHWRPSGGDGESGTPTEWLAESFDLLIEVACVCSAELALSRFTKRERHPGHLDHLRVADELAGTFMAWESRYPLMIGHLVLVRTDAAVSVGPLIEEVAAVAGQLED